MIIKTAILKCDGTQEIREIEVPDSYAVDEAEGAETEAADDKADDKLSNTEPSNSDAGDITE